MIPQLSREVSELGELCERFAALSDCAARACESGDAAALGAALDARDLLVQRAAVLAQCVRDGRRTVSSKAGREALDAVLRPLRALAAEAERANADLAHRARAARTALGEQLDRLRHDDAARSAYATAACGEAIRLDVTR